MGFRHPQVLTVRRAIFSGWFDAVWKPRSTTNVQNHPLDHFDRLKYGLMLNLQASNPA